MPMSNSSEFVLKVCHVLLLLLLVPQRRLAKLHFQNTKQDAKNELNTFTNSYLIMPDLEISYYLLRNRERKLLFRLDESEEVSYFSLTVTACGVQVKWTFGYQTSSTNDYPSPGELTELYRYEGEGRQTYNQDNPAKAVYQLFITSLENDSYVRVYLSYDQLSIYPSLPLDPRVHVSTNNSLFTLNWLPAGRLNGQPIEYCLTINRVKNLPTYCGAMAYLRGDKKPRLMWTEHLEQSYLENLHKNARPLKKWGGNKLFHQCVNNKTSFTYGKARRGKTYYVDVYMIARREAEQVSSAYIGTMVKIRRIKNTSTLRMMLGETRTFKLKYQHKVVLHLNTTVSKLAIEVMPCEGKVPFTIYHNGRRIQRKTLVKRWHRRLLQTAQPGTYILSFPSLKKKTFVTISIKANFTRSKLVLPRTFLIKASRKTRSCSSVMLEWTAASVKQKYCVYKREIKQHDLLRRRCMNADKRPANERVSCIYSNSTTLDTGQKMFYNVQDLKQATRYRFDVFLSRGQSASMSYKSVTVKTRHCNSSKG
ncbi:protein NDNF [Biomphalaria pfeifferi]|uniref:Protein NDNF n=1 Tax=Biomphalaria pfeifferi TaxID=112525 RepID=A0AAD8FA44_BIOPF|nr:protein NDNF [Biomphalaria pfeifferi]